MKRFAAVLALVGAVVVTATGTATAGDTNVGVQVASIKQVSLANASAVQYGAFLSLNAANASSANYASIGQWLTQTNH